MHIYIYIYIYIYNKASPADSCRSSARRARICSGRCPPPALRFDSTPVKKRGYKYKHTYLLTYIHTYICAYIHLYVVLHQL